jgi:hypothetical protein
VTINTFTDILCIKDKWQKVSKVCINQSILRSTKAIQITSSAEVVGKDVSVDGVT